VRVLAALILIVGLALPGFAQNYDRHFVDYTVLHFGSLVSPKWIKATAMAESNLKADARSGVGASGMLQFMSSTWSDVAPEPWKTLGPLDPEAAIFVGARYMRQIWNRFPDVATVQQRKGFVNASYNSGMGWIFKARNACKTIHGCDASIWDAPNVEKYLLTAPRFQLETRSYVQRIRRLELNVFLE
jgi:membrane-bound lytic murein transglycosylase MltF